MNQIKFFYDFGSPNASLVHRIMPNIAAWYDVDVAWSPVLLGGMFGSPSMFWRARRSLAKMPCPIWNSGSAQSV